MRSICFWFRYLPFILSFLMLVSCASNPIQSGRLPVEMLDQFTKYAEKVRTDWQIPGMSIAIVEKNNVIYARGFGFRNENGDPVDQNTLFDIASMTKSFTTALL